MRVKNRPKRNRGTWKDSRTSWQSLSYKGGTEGAANTGNEPYSEYYACQIADKMGIGCVQYDLENWKGILASKCRLFTDIDTSFVPIGRILRKTTLKACLDYYKTLGDEFYEQLCSNDSQLISMTSSVTLSNGISLS